MLSQWTSKGTLLAQTPADTADDPGALEALQCHQWSPLMRGPMGHVQDGKLVAHIRLADSKSLKYRSLCPTEWASFIMDH